MAPYRRATGSVAVQIALLLASLTAAAAQETGAMPPGNDDESVSQIPETPLDVEGAAALGEALNDKPNHGFAAPRPAHQASTPGLDWKRTTSSDGTTAYTVKRMLPIDWDTKIGADLILNDARNTELEPGWSPPSAAAKNTGAAWTNVQVPGVVSLDARVGTGNEPSKFGVSRTLQFGGTTSLTVQNSYAVTEDSAGAPAGLAAPRATSIWSNDRQVKLNIASTGTTFGAGSTSSSADSIAHNRLSAEQKLFDKFNITTTFSDIGAPISSRSITAGFKMRW